MAKKWSRLRSQRGTGPPRQESPVQKTVPSQSTRDQDNRSWWETSVVDLPVDEILAGLAMVCCRPRAFGVGS